MDNQFEFNYSNYSDSTDRGNSNFAGLEQMMFSSLREKKVSLQPRASFFDRNVSAREYRCFMTSTMSASFAQTVFAHTRRLGLNQVVFSERTLLDDRQFRKIKANTINSVSFDTVMAICVGLDLGLEYGLPLLEKAGFSLNAEHRFHYKMLLIFFRGYTIVECNYYLVDQGAKPIRESACRELLKNSNSFHIP